MSNYGWEQGTIRLPTAAFTDVRRATAEALRQHQTEAVLVTQRCWGQLRPSAKRNPSGYQDAVSAFVKGLSLPGSKHVDPATAEAAAALLWTVAARPRRVLKSDLDWPTNRWTRFPAGDGTITFDRAASTVSWAVDGNHAIEGAHATPTGTAFFAALDKVCWTRKSGGVLVGNDEYNQADDYPGGGANYVTVAYGPIGEAEAPSRCRPYSDTAGRRHRQPVVRSRW